MDNFNRNERNITPHRQYQDNNKANMLHQRRDNVRDFDRNMYDTGRNWQKSGLPLSGASDSMRKNMAFIKGYDREKNIGGIQGREDR